MQADAFLAQGVLPPWSADEDRLAGMRGIFTKIFERPLRLRGKHPEINTWATEWPRMRTDVRTVLGTYRNTVYTHA